VREPGSRSAVNLPGWIQAWFDACSTVAELIASESKPRNEFKVTQSELGKESPASRKH